VINGEEVAEEVAESPNGRPVTLAGPVGGFDQITGNQTGSGDVVMFSDRTGRHPMRNGTGYHPPRGRALRTVLLALLATLVALASACGGDASPESDMPPPPADEPSPAAAVVTTAAFAAPPPAALEEAAPSESAIELGAADGARPALGVPTALSPADIGRDIVYRATITVEAEDVAAAGREAVAIVEGLGGIVFAQTTQTVPRPRAEITFKVLPADFATALERLAGIGELVDQTVSADDVTERIVDLESRIITAEASVLRLRGFLEQAVRLEDVAQLEQELLDRETTLETLRGQLRTLRGQVDLATITLTIHHLPEVVPVSGLRVDAWVSDDAADACFGDRIIAVEPDDRVHFCVEVENVGESVLTDVEIGAENVRLRGDSFRAVQGGFRRIEPGDLLVATLPETVEEGRLGGRAVSRGLDVTLTAEAVPVDAEGIALAPVSASTFVLVEELDDRSLPSFVDTLVNSARFGVSVVRVALIVLGALVPFLPVIAGVVALIWWRRRRQSAAAPPAPPADS
jgi:hypothetical protein